MLPIGDATGNDFFRALAFTGFFLNLFNLLPVVPLDGGRAMAAMSPWMWFVGLRRDASALAFVFPNPIILLILLLGGLETWRRWKTRKQRRGAARPTTASRRASALVVAAVYLGLIALLVLGMDATHVARTLRRRVSAVAARASASRSARSMSRLVSRSLIVSRLSKRSLPRASAISTLARGR